MKKEELASELDKLHVPKSIYNLKGNILPNNTVLEKMDSNWRVFSIGDRGGIYKEQRFLSEDEACNYIYNEFKQWFNYELRNIDRITSLLKKRPQLNSQRNFLDHFFEKLGFKFPKQLESFYHFYNGAEGYIGKNTFIDIWSIENLDQKNKEFDLKKSLPSFYLFARSNENEGFAINKNNSQIYEIKNLSKLNENECSFCSKDFDNFLFYLFDK